MNAVNGKKKSDEEILRLAQQGDKEGVEMLVQRYRPYIFKIVKGMVRLEAEDLTQDIVIKVILAVKNFKQQSSLTTWLYRITINHVLQHKRQQKKQTRQVPDVEHEINEPLIENIDESITEDALYLGMLLCLDESQRTVVSLSDIFKLDHNQAADMLQINPAAFRKRLSRAREDLKSWLSGECSLAATKGSCQCKHKAKKFKEKGWVNEETLKFEQVRIQQAKDILASFKLN